MLPVHDLYTTIIIKLLISVFLFFFYFTEKKDFLNKWAFSILFCALSCICDLLLLQEKFTFLLSFLKQITLITAPFFAIRGSYSLAGKKLSPIFYLVTLMTYMYAAVGLIFQFPALLYQVPISLFNSISAIVSGMLFIKHLYKNIIGRYWLAVIFILFGIYMMNAPFLESLEWFGYFRFTLNILFDALIPISIVLVILQQAKEGILQGDEFRRHLFDFLPDAVFIHKQGKVIFANPAGIKLLGASSLKDIVGKASMDFVHPDYLSVAEHMSKSLYANSPNTQIHAIKMLRVDGSSVDVESRGLLYTSNGEQVLISIHRDLSERNQSESLRKNLEENSRLLREVMEMNKVKTEFFANISHELRTPLNVLLSSIQLMNVYISDSYPMDTDKIKNHLTIMKQNCFRLLKLINNLIDTTKIETGFLNFLPQNCNIVSIIEETTHSVYEYVKFRGISIQFDTQEEEIITACDIEKIERIMLNLLSNAVKFTPEGGNIYVNMACDEDHIYISVRDTGIGIAENKLDLIFERFRQADQTFSRKHEGSGIGLSLVKSLVEMHNGTVTVKSNFGSGSEFIIKLPIRILHKEPVIYSNSTHNGYTDSIDLEFADIK